MSLTAIKGPRGEDLAFCACDACGAEKTIPARHGDRHGFSPHLGRKNGRYNVTLHSEATVIETLCKGGWSNIKGRLRCPKCTLARTEKTQEVAMQTETAPRQPTPEQEVDIIVALSSVYDRKAKRYAGVETDRSVAEVIGGGCMPGWVAKIRADKFGPAGNEEAEAIRSEIASIRDSTAKSLDALTARLDRLYASEDKRVTR